MADFDFTLCVTMTFLKEGAANVTKTAKIITTMISSVKVKPFISTDAEGGREAEAITREGISSLFPFINRRTITNLVETQVAVNSLAVLRRSSNHITGGNQRRAATIV